MMGGLPAAFRAVLRHRRASRAELVAYQGEQLRRLVRHASHRVPHYRRLFDEAGVDPRRILTPADLSLLPITTRDRIQQLPAAELVAEGFDPDRLLTKRTSGSSGQPIAIRHTWSEQAILYLVRLRAMQAIGVRPWHRIAVVSYQRARSAGDRKLVTRTLARLGIGRRIPISTLRSPSELVTGLVQSRADVIMGYTGALAEAAVATVRLGATIRPRLVCTGAEPLTPLARERLGEAFGAPVRDLYGSHEFGLIGWTCPETDRIHLADDSVLVEVLVDGRPARPGETGTLVATALHSFAMPFIRYELGDLVTLAGEGCPCGAPFTTLERIQGRVLDYFTLPDGTRLHPTRLISVLRGPDAGWIGRFALLQERRDRVVVRLVPRGPIPEDGLGRVERALADALGPAVALELEIVSAIPAEANGKFRAARSLVGQEVAI